MNSTIDQTALDVRAVCNEIAEMLIKKNQSYGDSALNPIRVFSRADPLEAIRVRMDDKLSRLKFGNGEFKEDTELDLLGYLVLHRIARKRLVAEEAAFARNHLGEIDSPPQYIEGSPLEDMSNEV